MTTSIYDFDDYRAYIKARFAEMPKGGYGQARKMAKFLGIHSTLISQVLGGMKSFSLEQAAVATEFLMLNEFESEYFLLLVLEDKAGHPTLKNQLQRQKGRIKRAKEEISSRVLTEAELSDGEMAVFYSDWRYSAVRQLSAIEGFQSVDAIANHLKISANQLAPIVEFLVATGLCRRTNNGLEIGPKSTHLSSSSKWIRFYHKDWRSRALDQLHMNDTDRSALNLTSPMTLSYKDSLEIREQLVKCVEAIYDRVDESKSEQLHCLNIDWFRV